MYEHITSTNHQGELLDFEVIGRDNLRNDFFLKVKESLLIKRYKPKLNENEASTPLSILRDWGWGGEGKLAFGVSSSLIFYIMFHFFR